MKDYVLIVFLVSTIFISCSIPAQSEIETVSSDGVLEGFNVLVFVADYVGNSYFVIKSEMELLGASVTTIGLTSTHFSCDNVEAPVMIETNVTINNFDIETFKDYKALILPSGGYWSSMLVQNNLMEFIELAYENNLLIASICIGMVLLSETSIVDGVTMVAHSTANSFLKDAGAILEYNARVVYDKGIVSGGTGGGLSGGRYLGAPHRELCLTLARRILAYSYITNSELVKKDSNYSLLVEVNKIEEVTNGDSNISKVIADIYDTKESLIDTINLELDGTSYKGELSGFKSGKYTVRIGVKTTDDILEISRDLISFTIDSTIPGFEIFSSVLALIALIVGILLFRREF